MMNPDETDDTLDILELDENLADVEQPPEVPNGNYVGEVQSVGKGVSGKGNTYYSVLFNISQDQIQADLQEHFPDGASMYWNRQVVPKKGDQRAKFSLRKFVEALGLDTNTTTVDPNEWMGCRAKLRVSLGKPYQGNPARAEINAVEKVEAAAPRAAAPATKKAGRR